VRLDSHVEGTSDSHVRAGITGLGYLGAELEYELGTVDFDCSSRM